MQKFDSIVYLEDWERSLVLCAKEASKHAYAPYSNYFVGAALIDESGSISIGCNVENQAYTGSHAETGAIAQMIVGGKRSIRALACYTKNGGSPCGDCRQRIWEFCGGNLEVAIYSINEAEQVEKYTIGELLPHAFDLNK